MDSHLFYKLIERLAELINIGLAISSLFGVALNKFESLAGYSTSSSSNIKPQLLYKIKYTTDITGMINTVFKILTRQPAETEG